MKRRMMVGMCVIAFISVFLTALFTIFVMYEEVKTNAIESVQTEASYVKSSYEKDGVFYMDSIDEALSGRIVIFSDKDEIEILYTSVETSAEIDEEERKQEIAEAKAEGSYLTSRYSATTQDETIYYYLVANDGAIVRVSQEITGILVDLTRFIPWLIIIIIMVSIVAFFYAKYQTERIIAPLETLNLEKPKTDNLYVELLPIVKKLERQRHEIRETVKLLEHRQEEFDAIIKNMSEGFVVMDKSGDVLTYNQSALKLCGYNGLFVLGSSVFRMNTDMDFYSAVERSLLGESLEFKQKIDGRFCKFLINPVIRNEEVTGAIIVIMDATEIENRDEMRREFTANVSHELKTPLTSISGYAEIIKTGIAKDKDIRGFAEKIYKEAQRLIELVADIINLSRLDESNGMLLKDSCDIFEISKRVLNRLESTAEKSNVTLQIKGESIVINGVANMLEEMIYNICDNAIKYNVDGGQVIVSLEKSENKTKISIKDTGIGIPAQDRERIFERFYRVDKSHSKVTGGTGLGLSIVKHCVQLHAGEILLESELGKGTNVIIEL